MTLNMFDTGAYSVITVGIDPIKVYIVPTEKAQERVRELRREVCGYNDNTLAEFIRRSIDEAGDESWQLDLETDEEWEASFYEYHWNMDNNKLVDIVKDVVLEGYTPSNWGVNWADR